MKIETKTAAYGLAGLAVAGAVIFSGSALGLLNVQASGLLSVLLTDPPTVPTGVTAIYITYTDVAVHAAGFGDSGWVSVAGHGTIETMSLINLSQTISSGAIPALDYNQVRFTISNASVGYMGKNYTAAVGSGMIEVPIVGGLKVNSSSPAATLVDIQPTVANLGGQARPSFTIAAGARALQVPSAQVDQSTKTMGHRESLEGHSWYNSFKSTGSTNLTMSGLTLSANSFSFFATNSGTDPLVVRTIVIAPSQKGQGEESALGSVVNGAAFAVQPDGSLTLLTGNPGQAEALLDGSGYSIAPGSAQQFSYSGAIANIFGNRGITAGTSYYVIVMGQGTLGVETVQAS
ncbi:MAG: DUF4382 domain-containing protein [Nitrososphaerota archaeon]|nr:DUF4382 domain-containing protein [Nitrososphaerota archaeon]